MSTPSTEKANILSIRAWPSLMKSTAASIAVVILVSVLLAVFLGGIYRVMLRDEQFRRLEQTSHEQAFRLIAGLTRDLRILQDYAASGLAQNNLAENQSDQTSDAFDSVRQEIPEIQTAALVSKTGQVAAFF